MDRSSFVSILICFSILIGLVLVLTSTQLRALGLDSTKNNIDAKILDKIEQIDKRLERTERNLQVIQHEVVSLAGSSNTLPDHGPPDCHSKFKESYIGGWFYKADANKHEDVSSSANSASTVVRKFDESNLVATALNISERVRSVICGMDFPECGTGPNDGLALLSAAILASVDVIIESGTAVGVSIETMAKVLPKRVTLYTVDLGVHGSYDCGLKVQNTISRLALYKNVHAKIGDSFKIFPEILKKHRGKRIGLWIDGPKGMLGLKLCSLAMRQSADIQFCAFHDVSYLASVGKSAVEAFTFLKDWQRTVLLTSASKAWLQHLDILPANTMVAIVAGTSQIPFGVEGDASL